MTRHAFLGQSILVASLLVTLFSVSHAAAPWTKLRKAVSKKTYTPLVFFKVPRGLIPECDAMEECVKKVEEELGVRVERLDILREPASQAVLATLTQKSPPFLYHRESCQTVHLQGTAGGAPDEGMPVKINRDRIRAWAKGRWLPSSEGRMMQGKKVTSPNVVLQQEESDAMSQDELLDMGLTPTQRQGKEAIQKRTEAQ